MSRFKHVAIILIIIIFTSVYVEADETGMWSINYYVDDFGGATNVGYITNTSLIKGTFSNVATQDSKLNVRFIIEDSQSVFIQLYEYGGTNPVKDYSSNSYTGLIQDKDGNRERFTMRTYSDRLKFAAEITTYISSDGKLEFSYGTHPKWIHDTLIKGGTVKFRITEKEYGTTIYKFEIQNADGYDNAYRKLVN